MKKPLFAAAMLLILAGCNRNQTAPGPLPVQSVTPVPRPAMDKRLAMLFPGSKVEKLTVGAPGEFFAVTKGGKPNGHAALLAWRNAKDKELQLLLVTMPDGKIKLAVAGLPGTAGQTKEIFALNTFLHGFVGKDGAALQKYSAPRDVDKKTAARAVAALKGALEMLAKKTG